MCLCGSEAATKGLACQSPPQHMERLHWTAVPSQHMTEHKGVENPAVPILLDRTSSTSQPGPLPPPPPSPLTCFCLT